MDHSPSCANAGHIPTIFNGTSNLSDKNIFVNCDYNSCQWAREADYISIAQTHATQPLESQVEKEDSKGSTTAPADPIRKCFCFCCCNE